jgi:hypothetical protein
VDGGQPDARVNEDARPPPADASDAVATYAPTYHAVWTEVLAPTCAVEFCHAGMGDYMVLTDETEGYAALVNAPAQGPGCTGYERVVPYVPDASLVYLKVTDPPCGHKMPYLPDLGSLDDRAIAQLQQWIACGAPPGDAGCDD